MNNNGNGKITHEFTFASSGRSITYQRVSRLLVQEFRRGLLKRNPPPEPPTQMIAVGGSEAESVENPSDPDHIAALATHDRFINERQFDFIIKQSFVNYDREAVKQLRATIDELGSELESNDNDETVFLFRLAALDIKEVDAFYDAVLSLSQPTPATLADAKDTF